MCAPISTFYMGFRDPNYILQTFVASTLSTEPSPQHHTGFSNLKVVIQVPVLETSYHSSYDLIRPYGIHLNTMYSEMSPLSTPFYYPMGFIYNI